MNANIISIAGCVPQYQPTRLWLVVLLTMSILSWRGDDAKGAAYEFVRSFGTSGSGNGQLNFPWGLALWNGGILVADTGNNRIQKFDWDGNYVDQFGGFGSGVGQFNFPQGVAANGSSIVVADTGNNRVQQFDMDGNYLTQYHEVPWNETPLSEPWAVAIDNFSHIFVADTGNARVVGLNWFQPFEIASDFPVGVAVTHSTIETPGTVWIADASSLNIAEFDISNLPTGRFVPDYYGLSNIALGPTEHIWIGDFAIEEYENTGFQLTQFGTSGTGLGEFLSISGITVDSRGHVWVADSSRNRVLEFRPLPEPSTIALAAVALVGFTALCRRKGEKCATRRP